MVKKSSELNVEHDGVAIFNHPGEVYKVNNRSLTLISQDNKVYSVSFKYGIPYTLPNTKWTMGWKDEAWHNMLLEHNDTGWDKLFNVSCQIK